MNRNQLFVNRFCWIFFCSAFHLSVRAQVAPLPATPGAGKKVHYVRTFTASIPERNPNVLVSKAPELGGGVQQSTQYLDGLGRVIQQNDKMASQPGDGSTWFIPKDIINIKRFDFDASQQAQVKNLSYLPFTNTGTGSDYSNGFLSAGFLLQEMFWQAKFPDEHYYYSEARIERSPLSRVEKTLGEGDAFVGSNNGVSVQNEFNSVSENVRLWAIVSGTGFLPPASSQSYAAAKLSKTITIDEKGKKIYTYTDFGGKVILKKVQEKESGAGLDENGHDGWLCTYYVYDDLDQLRVIIPPKAVKYLQSTGYVFGMNMTKGAGTA